MCAELRNPGLEHEFSDVLLTDDGCRKVDSKNEKDANFLAGELLIPCQAALKAAFAEKTNEEMAAIYRGASSQLASSSRGSSALPDRKPRIRGPIGTGHTQPLQTPPARRRPP